MIVMSRHFRKPKFTMAFKFTIMITAFHIAYSLTISGSGNYIIPNTCYELTCSYDTFKDDRQTVYNFLDEQTNGIKSFTLRYLNSTGLCYYRNPEYRPCTDDVCSCDIDGMATHICYNHTSNITGNITINCFSGNNSIIRIPVAVGPGSSMQFEPSITSVTKNKGDQLGPINCAATCNPPCQYKWTKLGKTVSLAGQLMFASLSIEDHGQMTCTASNGIGSSGIKSLDVIVNYGPMIVILLPPTQQYTVEYGDTIPPINCSANCRPDCIYIWSGPNVTSGVLSVLSLPTIQKNQSGNYQCLASNEVGSMLSSIINVTVQFGPGSSLQFYPSNTSVTKKRGDKLGPIECRSTCNPPCQYKWTTPNKTIINDRYLTIESLSTHDHGTFICTALNRLGNGNNNLDVNVNYEPIVNRVTINGTNFTVSENTTVILSCNYEGNPAPTITWKKNNLILSEDDENNGRSFYTINTVRCKDTGNYSCVANNLLGLSSVQKSLFVTCSPDPPTDMLVICQTSPMVVLWKPGFNGGTSQWFTVIWKDMKTNTSMVSSSIPDSGNGQYVKVTTSSLSDGATYLIYVEASNKYGRKRATIYDNCTTKSAKFIQSENCIAVGVGAGIGTSLMILILAAIVVFIFKRLRRRKNTGNAIYEASQSGSRELSVNEDHIYNDLQQFQGDNNKQHRDQATYANQSFGN